MSRLRLVIFALFICVFAVAAPSLLLYANGWRLDINQRKLVQTGAVFLNMNVRGARILIDNNLEKTVSPINSSVLIRNLLPGIKKIRVEKEGFDSWQKEVNIDSEKTARFANILLLPQKIDKKILLTSQDPENIVDFSAAPKGNTVALKYSSGKIKIWDRGNDAFLPLTLKALPQEWSPDGNFLLINESNSGAIKTELLDIYKTSPYNPASIFGLKNPELLSANGVFVAGLIERRNDKLPSLASVDYKRDKNIFSAPHEIAKDVKAFAATSKEIFFVDKANMVLRIEPDGSGLKQISPYTLPFKDGADIRIFVDEQGENVAVQRINGGHIWLLNKQNGSFEPIADNINHLSFSADNKKVLLASDHEILIYYLKDIFNPDHKTGSHDLIARLSTELSNVWWHHQNEHVMIQDGNRLLIYEIDVRDNINTGILLNDATKIQALRQTQEFLATDGKELYSTEVPRIEGLFGF